MSLCLNAKDAVQRRAASVVEDVETVGLPAGERLADLSYSAQYDRIFQQELDPKKVHQIAERRPVISLQHQNRRPVPLMPSPMSDNS